MSGIGSALYSNLDGLGQVVWHPDGRRLFSVGVDSTIRVFDSVEMEEEKSIDYEPENASGLSQNLSTFGLNVAAISPKGDTFVVGGKDRFVPLYTLSSDGEVKFEKNLTRFASPILCLAFHPTQNKIAVSGDCNEVRIVDVVDNTIVDSFDGLDGSVKFLAFDPQGVYLAASTTQGKLYVWDMVAKKCLVNETRFPRVAADSCEHKLQMSWSPDGQFLALPGSLTISLLKRGTWKPSLTLPAEHVKPTSIVQFSPNGRYLCSSGEDNTMCIWDIKQQTLLTAVALKDIDADSTVTALTWAPSKNELVFLSKEGYLRKWSQVIAEKLVNPYEDIVGQEEEEQQPAVEEKKTEQKQVTEVTSMEGVTETGEKEDDDDDNKKQDEAENDSDSDDDGQRRKSRLRTTAQLKKKKIRNGDLSDDAAEDAGDGSDNGYYDRLIRQQHGFGEEMDGKAALQSGGGMAHVLAPFQPGATPINKGARFLCWNAVGSITSRSEGNFSSIEIVFSDSTKNRAVRLRDHYNFSMASMGEQGALMASQEDVDTSVPSTVFYRPFESWTANADWTFHLPQGENAMCVALGHRWAAIFTSKQYLRIMSHSGVQQAVLSVPGPVLTMVGNHDTLAIVYQQGSPLFGTQSLNLLMMDMKKRTRVSDAPLPVSPGAELTWIGFADNGMFLSFDSVGVLRGLLGLWGGQWGPLLETEGRGRRDKCWPVAVSSNNLMCVVCKGRRKYPVTQPRPVLGALSLSLPLLNPEKPMSVLENMHARECIMSYQTNQGGPPTAHQQALMDKSAVQMIKLACSAELPATALDISTGLGLRKSLAIGIQIANHLKKPVLAERMSLLLQAKFPDGRQQIPTNTPPTAEELFTYSSVEASVKSVLNRNRNAASSSSSSSASSSSSKSGKRKSPGSDTRMKKTRQVDLQGNAVVLDKTSTEKKSKKKSKSKKPAEEEDSNTTTTSSSPAKKKQKTNDGVAKEKKTKKPKKKAASTASNAKMDVDDNDKPLDKPSVSSEPEQPKKRNPFAKPAEEQGTTA